MTKKISFLVLLHLIISIFSQISGSHSGSPKNRIYSHSHNFAASGGATNCKLEFNFSPASRSYGALMYASQGTTNLLSTSYDAYQHAFPNQIYVDLQNANKGKAQTVQLPLTGPQTIMIQVIVNSVYSFSYTITITSMVVTQVLCLYPPKQVSNSQYCINCLDYYLIGAYCSILDISLSNNTQRQQQIPPRDYVAFTIPGSSSQITFNYYSDQPDTEVFIQFKIFSGQVAGFLNAAPVYNTPSGYADYLITNPANTYQAPINSGGYDVSIGVINQNSATTINFTAWYTVASTVNILVIVLGVLGGFLLIALIVAACFIVRRMRSPVQLVHPQSSAAMLHLAQLQENMLTPAEIQIYFPSVSSLTVFANPESSSLSINNNSDSIDRDCVICLCPVDATQLMKVTYCRHIFHGHCLVQWFKKQRNCPYCREEYTKSSTIAHYQQLLKETKRNMLAGVDLVRQIIKAKVIKSSVLIQDMKD